MKKNKLTNTPMVSPCHDLVMESEILEKREKIEGLKFRFKLKRFKCPECGAHYVAESEMTRYHRAYKKFQEKVGRRLSKPR